MGVDAVLCRNFRNIVRGARTGISVCAALTCLGSPLAAAQSAETRCPIFGRYAATVENLERPVSIAYAPNGQFALVEADAKRVRIFGVDGAELHRVEASPSASGTPAQPWSLGVAQSQPGPAAVAYAPEGQLAIASPGRVLILDQNGMPERTLSGLRTGDPSALAWRGEELLIADRGLGAVVVLAPDGTQRSVLRGDLRRPSGLAVAKDGSVFVSDQDLHAVLRFAPDGSQVARFGERGSFPGLFNAPSGLALRGDCLYIADELNHRIAIHAADGSYLGQWGMHAVIPREGEGKIHYPVAIAMAPDGASALVAEPFERRMQRFELSEPGDAGQAALPSRDGVQSHFGGAVAADGELLVLAEPESSSLFVFDLRGPTPIHVSTFGGSGLGIDKSNRVTALAVNGRTQRVVVADPGSRRISIFALDRDASKPLRMDPFMPRLVRSWDLTAWSERARALPDIGAKTLADSSDLADPTAFAWRDDDLWVLDGGSGDLVRVDARLAPVERLASGVRGGTGLATLADAGFAIAAPSECAIILVDGRGVETARWSGSSEQPLVRPTAISRLPSGEFAVTDAGADRVLLFRPDGGVAAPIGERGISDGAMWSPDGVAALRGGPLAPAFVVVDRGNHRAQVFGEDGVWRMTFGLGRAYTRPRERGGS